MQPSHHPDTGEREREVAQSCLTLHDPVGCSPMGIEFSSTWMEVRDGTGSARREAVGAGRRVTSQDANEESNLPLLGLDQSFTL